MKEVTLKIPDSKLKFFLELVNQLGFETKNEDLEFPSMSKEEIVKQALNAETEIEKGLTMSHEQAYLEFKKWK